MTRTWGSHLLLRLCSLAPSHRGWSPIEQCEFASSCAKTLSSETTFFLKPIVLSGHGWEEINYAPTGFFILWDHVITPCSYKVYPWTPFAPSPCVKKLDKTSICCYLDLQTNRHFSLLTLIWKARENISSIFIQPQLLPWTPEPKRL